MRDYLFNAVVFTVLWLGGVFVLLVFVTTRSVVPGSLPTTDAPQRVPLPTRE